MLPLIQIIWRSRKNCCLPVLASDQENYLQFIAYQENDVLQTNRYHILEPEFDPARVIALMDINVVFVPLTAFDNQGYRLGSGGGYYDRTFAFLNSQQRPSVPFLIGVGFAEQQVENLPHDGWDVKLDGVLTEKEFLKF